MGTSAYTSVIANTGRDRHFGGSTDSIVADPYISGRHYIKWTQLPDLGKYATAADGAGGISDKEKIKSFLESNCMAVTPPGGTLNKATFNGVGGTKWHVPTNIVYGDTLTIKFTEFAGTPVANIFHGWIRMIRDYKAGVTPLSAGSDLPEYTKSAYAGSLLYWTTAEDGKTVQYSAAYTGVFPTKDPQDLFTGDVATSDKLEIDMEFSLDWIWHEDWVHEKAQSIADNIANTPAGYRSGDGVDENIGH